MRSIRMMHYAPQWMISLLPFINDNISRRHQRWLTIMISRHASTFHLLDDAAWNSIRSGFLLYIIQKAMEGIAPVQPKEEPEYWRLLKNVVDAFAHHLASPSADDDLLAIQSDAEAAAGLARKYADRAVLSSAQMFAAAQAAQKLGYAIHDAASDADTGIALACEACAQAIDAIVYGEYSIHLPLRRAHRLAQERKRAIWEANAICLFRLIGDQSNGHEINGS